MFGFKASDRRIHAIMCIEVTFAVTFYGMYTSSIQLVFFTH
jgi:hypothetical protein